MASRPERIDARNRRAALDRFFTFLGQTLTCVADRHHWMAGDAPARYQPHLPDDTRSAFLPNAPVTLTRGRGAAPLYLAPSLTFRIVKDDQVRRREFRVSTLGYIYVVSTTEDLSRPVFEWHSHAYLGPPHPHLHLVGAYSDDFGELGSLHVPTARIAFEDVVWFLIDELGVAPARTDWRNVLDDSGRRFRKHNRW